MDKLAKKIFLIDGLGALVSASLLYFVVVGHPDFFGLEPKIGKCLAIAPVFFCIYSLLCHFVIKPKRNFSLFLLIIALVNTLYCVFTFYLVFISGLSQSDFQLTEFGKVYFIVELLIVLPLVLVEIKIARHAKKYAVIQ